MNDPQSLKHDDSEITIVTPATHDVVNTCIDFMFRYCEKNDAARAMREHFGMSTDILAC